MRRPRDGGVFDARPALTTTGIGTTFCAEYFATLRNWIADCEAWLARDATHAKAVWNSVRQMDACWKNVLNNMGSCFPLPRMYIDLVEQECSVEMMLPWIGNGACYTDQCEIGLCVNPRAPSCRSWGHPPSCEGCAKPAVCYASDCRCHDLGEVVAKVRQNDQSCSSDHSCAECGGCPAAGFPGCNMTIAATVVYYNCAGFPVLTCHKEQVARTSSGGMGCGSLCGAGPCDVTFWYADVWQRVADCANHAGVPVVEPAPTGTVRWFIPDPTTCPDVP